MSARPLTIADFAGSGGMVIRFERADGVTSHHRIEHGSLKLRMMPGGVTGDDVERFLYACTGLDPHRYVWDLPSSVKGTGSARTGAGGAAPGDREGFAFMRGADGKPDGNPIGKVYFLTSDRRFREGDPEDRRDFEALR